MIFFSTTFIKKFNHQIWLNLLMDDHTSAIPQNWKKRKQKKKKKLIPISMNLILKQRWARVAIEQGIEGQTRDQRQGDFTDNSRSGSRAEQSLLYPPGRVLGGSKTCTRAVSGSRKAQPPELLQRCTPRTVPRLPCWWGLWWSHGDRLLQRSWSWIWYARGLECSSFFFPSSPSWSLK